MTVTFPLRRRRGLYAGFSMAETIICVVVVSVLFVAALNTAGSAATTRRRNVDSANGMLLAQDIMSEILQLPYKDPDGSATLGIEAGEAIDATRQWFDDIDDYGGWNQPPQDKIGNLIAWAGRYQIRISVQPVTAANLSQTDVSDTGIKRVRVEVLRGGVTVASLTSFRTQTWGRWTTSAGNQS